MSASTTRLSLTKPGGGSTGLITPADIVDIDVLNANFDKIDAAIGAQVVTSTTLPSTPFAGEFVFESDTKRIRVYQGGSFVAPSTERGSLTTYSTAAIAALDAIADAQVGDLAYMSDPGNGNAGTGLIDALKWEAISGTGATIKWRTNDRVVTDTKAHLDTFIAAVAATDLQFRIGQEAFLTASGTRLRFTSTAGAYVGLGLVRPTAAVATTGTSTINDDGSITVVFTGAGNVILQNVFAALSVYATTDFDVDLYWTGTVSTLGVRMAAAGVIDASAANHDQYGQGATQAGVATPSTSLNAAAWGLTNGISALLADVTIEFKRPNVAVATKALWRFAGGATLGTSETEIHGALTHRLSTAWDGFQVTVAAAGTLTIKVRPR
jgi:hypothetical protein